MTFEYFVM